MGHYQRSLVSVPAKCLALSMMLLSLVYVVLFVAEGWALPLGLALALGAVAGYIITRPHRISV